MMARLFTTLCLLASAVAFNGPATTPVAATTPASTGMPFFVERNDGQYAKHVRFAARAGGYTIAFADGAVGVAPSAGGDGFTMRFAGVAAPAEPIGQAPLAGRVNYFRGDATTGISEIPTFGQVRYPDVWPGIDAVFYGSGARLEYDLVVAAGTEASQIRLAFDAAQSVAISGDGELLVRLGNDDVRFSHPVAYQILDGRRTPVETRYAQAGGNEVSFRTESYDRTQPLIIDPLLLSTLLNGGAASAVDMDAAGNIYVASGSTGNVDTCVTKLSTGGRALVYLTCIGGAGVDRPIGLALDSRGSAYVLVFTDNDGGQFPTTPGAFQTGPGGMYDGVLVKLSPAGERIIYSTYIAGNSDDFGPGTADLEVDANGNAYVVGGTGSPNFPTTAGAYRRTFGGTRQGLALKMNPAGTALIYSTFLGNLSATGVEVVDRDGSYQVVISGTVNLGDSFTPTIPPPSGVGGGDAVLLKLNGSGSALLWSRLYGGSNVDVGTDIALGPDGAIWLVGQTESTNLPFVTGDSEQPAFAGIFDAFLARFSPDGTLSQATYLGGSEFDTATAVGVSEDDVVVFGYTESPDLPIGTREGIYDATFNGQVDGFVAQIRPNQGREHKVTYFGGGSFDYLHDGVLDGNGRITFAGSTGSADFPRQAQLAGQNGSGFVAQLADVTPGTVTPQDYVVHVAAVAELNGNWRIVDDPSAAGGQRVHNPDAGLPRPAAPLANPVDYFEFDLPELPGSLYAMWVRGKADGNSYTNDSVWVQYEGGESLGMGLGSTSAAAVVIEDCSGCELRGWGWQDHVYGRKAIGFVAPRGPTRVRVQRREDGVSIDQIVFSQVGLTHSPYDDTPPGYQKDDTTILPASDGPPSGGAGEVVIYAATDTPQLYGKWVVVADATAAGGMRITHPDQNAPKVTTPLAAPTNYVDLAFSADAGVTYHLYVRGKAARDDPYSDSVYVQLTNNAGYAIGSTNAISINLETCSGAGLAGWGWRSGRWCDSNTVGTPVVFTTSGAQTIRIQTREDGVSIDQIVLSSERFAAAPPGSAKNDSTIVPK